MNFQESKFSKGNYKRGKDRSNRNWRGGGRGRNLRSTQQRHKEQHFSNNRKNFSNGIYKFGNEFSTHSSSYGVLNQNVQLSVHTKKEHIRPKSPFPGSEEYTQRNIEKASDFIKRQLQIDENVSAKTYINSSHIHENLHTDCNEFPTYTDFKSVNSYSTKSDNIARCSDNDHYNVYSPKNSFSTSSHQKIKLQQMYDVSEIHNKLINHISNLSHAKKVNIINQVGPTGYDLAVQQIQKQKRIELSHALREMCKEQCFNEKTETINSIIPDFDIPIESLPKEIIEKLSTSLDVHFDDGNFSFPNLKQINNDYLKFPRNSFCVPDPIVPETYFQQAEDLLKDSLEYLPECKQFKTDLFPRQNLDINDTFLQENITINDDSSFENLPDFNEFYQPSPQGSDMDQSNFQDDNVALPCPFNTNNDHSNNLKENINFEPIQCEEMTKKEYLTVPDFIGKQNQNKNTRSKSNLGGSTVGHVQSTSNLNMNIEQNQQQINSSEYSKVLQNELENAEIQDTVEQYLELQPTDKIKKDQVKFKSEKIHFEITSRRKLFNKKVCDVVKSQSKEVDSIFNVKIEKLNCTKETDVELKNKGNCSKKGDEIKQTNKLQNNSDSNKESDYFVKNDLVGKQIETTTALMTEQPNNLELENNIAEQNSKNYYKTIQKNKISLNRDSYKETMKIINETDYYKHSSKNPPMKNKNDIGFSCLTKNLNPYTSYLKPSKIPLERNKKQACQKGHNNATKFLSGSNSKTAKEDLAIEEIVKGFSPRKKNQGITKVRIITLKGMDESCDSTEKVDKKKSFKRRREKRRHWRIKQRNAKNHIGNELEEELLQTAYKEMENDDKHVKVNVPTNTNSADSVDDKYSNSFSVDFTDIDKISESYLTNNTKTTTSEKTVLANNTPDENVGSNYSQSCKDNDKIPSNASTIQSIYEYEKEDLDYDYDMFIDINKSIVKGADLKDDEMVRLWEKRAKDVHNVDEKNVLEDGKLWNNFVEKFAGDVTNSNQDDGLVLATNSKTDNEVTNLDKVNEIVSGNLEKSEPEKESSSMASIQESVQKLKKSEILFLKDCQNKGSILNDVEAKLKIGNNVNLLGNNGIKVDTIKTNNNLMGTEKDLNLETYLVENLESSTPNISNVNKLTTFRNELNKEYIDEQLNDLKNEAMIVKINQKQNLDGIKNLEKNTNKNKMRNTLQLENINVCHCINERNIHSKCVEKNCTFHKEIIKNGKDIPKIGKFQVENKHIYCDKKFNTVETKQKDHRSSSRESCKSSNKERKIETKENTAHKTHFAHKTSLNKSEFSRKEDDTLEESVDIEKGKLQNKSYHTSDDRKRKIRVRNNYSQTEKYYSMKDIELQTENNHKEYNDQMIQCQIDNNIPNIKNKFHGINESSKLTRNDAVTKLIEIDKQIDNLLKIRQGFYKVLYDDNNEKVHCKLPNASIERNAIAHENNNLVMKSKLSDNSQLKIYSTKRHKLKKDIELHGIHDINIHNNNQIINSKVTASLISTKISKENQFISPNDLEKLNAEKLIEQEKVSSSSKRNSELSKNKVLENTAHNNDGNMMTVERGHRASNRDQQNINEMKDLRTATKNVCITNKYVEVRNDKKNTKEVPKDNECGAVNEGILFVASKLEQENVSLSLEKKNIVCDVFNIKKCNNKRNQIVRDKIQNSEENQMIIKQKVHRSTKRRKRKHSSFITNKDYVENLRHINNKTVSEVTFNDRNEQNTLKPSRKGTAQENNEGINKENHSVQSCQNVSHMSEINLEKEIIDNFSLDEPEHKRKRKHNKTETANIEANFDKGYKLKNNLSKEPILEKYSTKGLQNEEETVVNNEKCENRNDLYEEMQKLKCIVRVERLPLEQMGTLVMPVLQNSKTLQCLGECSNLNLENEFEHISQFNEQNEDEKCRSYAINEVCSDSKQSVLKQSTNEFNSKLHLTKVIEENFIKLPKNDNSVESDKLRDLTCHNLQVEQYEGCMDSSPCTENKVDLNCNQNLKMEQEIVNKGDSEDNVFISTNHVGSDLEEIFFKNFEGVILVIKVVSGVIIAASDKGKLFCYSMSSGLLLHTINVCSVAITSLCVLRNTKEEEVLYTGSLDVKLNIYNFITKEKIKSENIGEPIQCMEYAWNYLFIGSDRGSIIRYDVQKEKVDYKEKIFDLNVLVLRATQEGTRKVLVVAARNNPVSVRDAMSGLLMRTMETPFCPTVYTLLLEKNFVFCGTSQHDILVYTFEDGQLIFKHEATMSKGVVCMQIVKNLLFAGCYNGNVYIYNIKTNKHLGTMTGPGGLLLSMEIVNRKIIVGTKSNKFKLWTIPNHYLAENENIT